MITLANDMDVVELGIPLQPGGQGQTHMPVGALPSPYTRLGFHVPFVERRVDCGCRYFVGDPPNNNRSGVIVVSYPVLPPGDGRPVGGFFGRWLTRTQGDPICP